ncbi:hypothetical protein WA026_005713 [Henosepilachna vigintioctopunctata]|uniref:Uncharacterized protein n=1 Tax=Henosepilachna vigintioctopunctata TaxID=420089 RepID=A0AAW1U2J7_9CUCU
MSDRCTEFIENLCPSLPNQFQYLFVLIQLRHYKFSPCAGSCDDAKSVASVIIIMPPPMQRQMYKAKGAGRYAKLDGPPFSIGGAVVRSFIGSGGPRLIFKAFIPRGTANMDAIWSIETTDVTESVINHLEYYLNKFQ